MPCREERGGEEQYSREGECRVGRRGAEKSNTAGRESVVGEGISNKTLRGWVNREERA